tara:strand:+ start:304 stop:561 length:258 start_codon:yes stop_codon:yes gene_type:complete
MVSDKKLVTTYIKELRRGKTVYEVAKILELPYATVNVRIGKLRTDMNELHDVVLPYAREIRADAVIKARKQALSATAQEVSKLLV